MIIGAAGMLGRRLGERLAFEHQPVSGKLRITAVDLDEVDIDGGDCLVGDIADVDFVDLLASAEPDVVYHLAAVVSADAEVDPDTAYDVNVSGLVHLLQAARLNPAWCPRIVLASSLAVHGSPSLPPAGSTPSVHVDTGPDGAVGDHVAVAPRSTYGTQKAVAELLLVDATRRGDVDGVALRLPTVVVRPGSPNGAASTFLSDIVREPLEGRRAVLPVERTCEFWVASPDAVVGQLIRAGTLSGDELGTDRVLTMPGITVTPAQLIDAVADVGGPSVRALVDDVADPEIAAIVGTWPARFTADAARRLGFVGDESVAALVGSHVAESHGDGDDVTGLEDGRLASKPVPPPDPNGAADPMDDAAGSVIGKVRAFIETLSDDERQVFAAMLAPAVSEAWADDTEVSGFSAEWTPTAMRDRLNQAIRDQRFRIEREDTPD